MTNVRFFILFILFFRNKHTKERERDSHTHTHTHNVSLFYNNIRGVWYSCLNNSFQCLNTETHIFTTLSNSHIFP